MLDLFDKKRPVLVIDDCALYRTAARGMLLKIGFMPEQIELAADAQSAMKMRLKDFQLVLCDYNLGKKTDGYQLLEQLKRQRLLSLDCIIVVVTGDASTETVRSFVDLDTDGYLVKPVSFNSLQSRLNKIFFHKRRLSKAYNLFQQSDYNACISLANEVVEESRLVEPYAQLLSAKALIKAGESRQAENLLKSLLSGNVKVDAAFELARLLIIEKKFSDCQELLSQFEADPVNCAKGFQLSALYHLAQNHYSAALEKIKVAIEMSPKNIERKLVQVRIYLAAFETGRALACIEQLAELIKHSYWDNGEFIVQHIQVLLDHGEQSHQIVREQSLTLVNEFLTKVKDRPMVDLPEGFELLAQARASLIIEAPEQGKQLLAQYLAVVKERKTPLSIWERFELAKVQFSLENQEAFNAELSRLKTEIDAIDSFAEKITLKSYLDVWVKKVIGAPATSASLRASGMNLLKQGEITSALNALLNAYELDSKDKSTAVMMITCLARSWPTGWHKNDVIALVQKCCETLKSSTVIRSPALVKHLSNLAQQLDMPQLTSAH